MADPRGDFEANALGTLNVLEAARLASSPPIVFFASTNKVYGGMEDVQIAEHETRYMYANLPLGIPETQLLDFHSRGRRMFSVPIRGIGYRLELMDTVRLSAPRFGLEDGRDVMIVGIRENGASLATDLEVFG